MFLFFRHIAHNKRLNWPRFIAWTLSGELSIHNECFMAVFWFGYSSQEDLLVMVLRSCAFGMAGRHVNI